MPSDPIDVSDDEKFSKTGLVNLRREEGTTNTIEFWMRPMMDGGKGGDAVRGDDCSDDGRRARELALMAAKCVGLDGISGDIRQVEFDSVPPLSLHKAVNAYLPAKDEPSPIKLLISTEQKFLFVLIESPYRTFSSFVASLHSR